MFTQTRTDERGRAVRDEASTTYTAAIESAAEFGRRLYTEAYERGWSRAARKVILGDGAEWIWNLAHEQFPGAVEIVDLYHARQHLWELARALYSQDEARQKRWIGRHQPTLDTGQIDGLLKRLRAIESDDPPLAEKLREETAYFEKNARRTRYGEFRKQALFVGSG